jgi:outer membrane murein-binding lipoprotein Lpp
MQMSRDTKTYKGNKRDQYTIVLEEIRDKFDLFGEALQVTNQNVVALRSDFEHLDRKMDVLTSDVYVLKNDVAVLKSDVSVLKSDVKEIKITLNKHNDKFDDHEDRIGHLETV